MTKKQTWTIKECNISKKELIKRITDRLFIATIVYQATQGNLVVGIPITTSQIKQLLLEPRPEDSKGNKRKIVIFASEGEISDALIEINKGGPFEDGSPGRLMVDVTGDLNNFTLRSSKKVL